MHHIKKKKTENMLEMNVRHSPAFTSDAAFYVGHCLLSGTYFWI